MHCYKPAAGAPLLRTTEGEAFPDPGKMIDPANRYYARLIGEGALVPATNDARSGRSGPDKTPKTETDKPAAMTHGAASKKEPRK